ncbi:MAG: thermonuclease family protein [Gemmatimonadota bacterium]
MAVAGMKAFHAPVVLVHSMRTTPRWSALGLVMAGAGLMWSPLAASTQELRCVVARVIDGDTLVCEGGERVRLTLINSPEMRVEPLGALAREMLETLSPPGTELRMEFDVDDRDRYGRTLAYLYLPDGRMLNEQMVRHGYAQTMVVPPNVKYVELIREAARLARTEGVGLWALGPEGEEPGSVDCSPAYPDHCIPPPPPDLDCGSIWFRNFRVLPPDPHGFDRDGNGVGCEGLTAIGIRSRGKAWR